ncbi:hypothetical protein [Alteromonas stellipolaris]|nr:hypothetical protein [Alteromonas stellipolaris]MDO6538896.1 hypothetical protein [Alteromonas stellipolaris]MDP2597247.1 hypothetical protein [Alteromonas stellipolaris]
MTSRKPIYGGSASASMRRKVIGTFTDTHTPYLDDSTIAQCTFAR